MTSRLRIAPLRVIAVRSLASLALCVLPSSCGATTIDSTESEGVTCPTTATTTDIMTTDTDTTTTTATTTTTTTTSTMTGTETTTCPLWIDHKTCGLLEKGIDVDAKCPNIFPSSFPRFFRPGVSGPGLGCDYPHPNSAFVTLIYCDSEGAKAEWWCFQ
jgi:hypothetical protein